MTIIWNGAYDSFDGIKEKITKYPIEHEFWHSFFNLCCDPVASGLRDQGRWKLLELNLKKDKNIQHQLLQYMY